MWYVIQVRNGNEQNICLQCERQISPQVLESCFIPRYEVKRKVSGTWVTEQKILFPGYLFLISDDLQQLYPELKKVVGLTRLLGTGDEIVPLSEDEVELLLRLGGDDRVTAMSEGIIEGSRVIVRTGPLQGMEGLIRKIDRHKRKAWLELPMFGGTQTVQVGLEITEKIKTVSSPPEQS